MAKSFEKQYMEVLTRYASNKIKINGKEIPVYSNYFDDLMNIVDIEKIIKDNKLTGKCSPLAIVQYFTIAPWDGMVIPMIAFIWSWGGPWAYVYNIKFPELSESGSVSYDRILDSALL